MKIGQIWNNKGITLIELVIGMGLLVLVLGIGFSLYYFGTSSFEAGTKRGDLQQNARLVANFITEEVRFAETVEILGSDGLNEFDDDFHYIFLDEAEGDIKHKEKREDEPPVVKFNEISREVDFDLQVDISEDADNGDNARENILEIAVSAIGGERKYEVTTDVLILNLVGSIVDSSGDDNSGTGIRYRYPPELEE